MPRNLITSVEAIRKAAKAANGERARISDGDGLYLLLNADGGSHGWRFDYTFGAKRKTISFGTFPDTGLALARDKANEARALLAAAINPSDARKQQREQQKAKAEAERPLEPGQAIPNSVKDWAQRYHARKTTPDKNGLTEWSEGYAKKFGQRMDRWVYPYIGDRQIAAMTWREILEVLRRPEAEGKRELTHTLRGYLDQTFAHAMVEGAIDRNEVKQIDSGAMLLPPTKKNMAAIIDPARLADLVAGIGVYNGGPVTRTALLLTVLGLARPFNVRTAEWAEIDLDAAVWTIPSVKMKGTADQKLNGRPHAVPLARQMVKALRELHPLTGHRRYVFPSERGNDRPMSENTINLALRAMGFSGSEQVAHGFRATARTLIEERVKVNGRPVPPAWIEAQLAHEKSGPLGSAYDRAAYLDQRPVMMQAWADYLDGLKKKPAKAAGRDEVAA